MSIIDFHTHLDEHWLGNPLMNSGEFIAGMDKTNVDIACIFTMQGFYNDCPTHNDLLLQRALQHPDRFIPFLTVDPKLGKMAVDETKRCLSNSLFRGIKFHTWIQSFAPSMVQETMVEILISAAEHQVPVLFHDGTPPYSTTFQIAALARLVPEATIVLGHAGLADYVYPAGQLIRDIPNLYACYCGPRPGDLEYLVQTGGADKVLFGSDFGIAKWLLLAERLDNVYESSLSQETLQKILYENAARLLKLNSQPLPPSPPAPPNLPQGPQG